MWSCTALFSLCMGLCVEAAHGSIETRVAEATADAAAEAFGAEVAPASRIVGNSRRTLLILRYKLGVVASEGAVLFVLGMCVTARNPTTGFGVPTIILQNARSAVKLNPFPAVPWDRPVRSSP